MAIGGVALAERGWKGPVVLFPEVQAAFDFHKKWC